MLAVAVATYGDYEAGAQTSGGFCEVSTSFVFGLRDFVMIKTAVFWRRRWRVAFSACYASQNYGKRKDSIVRGIEFRITAAFLRL